jgi:flagellar hook-length control protein FliK
MAEGVAQSGGPVAATGQTPTQTPPSVPTGDAPATSDAASGAQQQPEADAAQPQNGHGGEHGRPNAEPGQRTVPATPAQPNGPGQPATPATPAQPANGQPTRAHGEPVRGAHLHQAAETVEATIRIAAQRGAGHARIALRPAELGGIEIRLRQTSAGLAATVVAEAPEAAQLLQQAAGELRRSLEDQGLQLLRLDVSVAEDHQAGHGAGAAGEERPRGRTEGGDAGDAGPEDGPAAEAETAVQLPNGVLVDVLA